MKINALRFRYPKNASHPGNPQGRRDRFCKNYVAKCNARGQQRIARKRAKAHSTQLAEKDKIE